MKNTSLKALNTLTAKHPAILESCYAVTMYNESINLQAQLTNESLTWAREFGTLEINKNNNWFQCDFEFENVLFNLTLTAI